MQETYRYLGMDTPDGYFLGAWIGVILAAPLIWKTWQRPANRPQLRRIWAGVLLWTLIGLICPQPISVASYLPVALLSVWMAIGFGRTWLSRLTMSVGALALCTAGVLYFPDRSHGFMTFTKDAICEDMSHGTVIIPATQAEVSSRESRLPLSLGVTRSYTVFDQEQLKFIDLDSTQLFWGPNGLTSGDRIAERFLAQSGVKKLASR